MFQQTGNDQNQRGSHCLNYFMFLTSRYSFLKKVHVAARLRSLRSNDPSSKGHPRSIKQELETWKHFKLIHELLDS